MTQLKAEQAKLLERRLAALPRLLLATLPTPLHDAPRLARCLNGPRILFKRDDLTGFGLGGNKARKLEHLIAAAVNEGSDVIVTGGGRQSNHVRMTAAAARSVGMDVVAVVYARGPNNESGNLLLDRLLGTEVISSDATDFAEVERSLDEVCSRLRASGRRPYLIPLGGSVALADAGYARCALELAGQLADTGVERGKVFLATGSGGTHAGLLAGARALGDPFQISGVTVSRSVAECKKRVSRLAVETAALLQLDLDVGQEDVVLHGDYIGPGYAVSTPESREAIRLVAEQEGVFLDPVYTGKAMAAVIDLIRRRELGHRDTVVFLHTGGIPALFAYANEFDLERRSAGLTDDAIPRSA